MRGRDFLTVAVQLRDIDSEAADRSRTSRAYYAAFLEARSFAETFLHLAPDRSHTTHRSVAAAVASIEPQLKVDFTFLRKARNSADYDMRLTRKTIADQAEQSCTMAASIIFRLDRHAMTLEAGNSCEDPGVAWFAESGFSPHELTDYLPNSPRAFDEAVLYLLSYPHLIGTIQHAIAIARQEYPGASPVIDTVRYESDEPPLRLMIRRDDPAILDNDTYHRFMARLQNESGLHDLELLAVFPDYAPNPTNDPRRSIEETHAISYQAGPS